MDKFYQQLIKTGIYEMFTYKIGDEYFLTNLNSEEKIYKQVVKDCRKVFGKKRVELRQKYDYCEPAIYLDGSKLFELGDRNDPSNQYNAFNYINIFELFRDGFNRSTYDNLLDCIKKDTISSNYYSEDLIKVLSIPEGIDFVFKELHMRYLYTAQTRKGKLNPLLVDLGLACSLSGKD